MARWWNRSCAALTTSWSKSCCAARDVDTPVGQKTSEEMRKLLLSSNDNMGKEDLTSLMDFIEQRVREIAKRKVGNSTDTLTTVANEANVFPDKVTAVFDSVRDVKYSQALTQADALLKDALSGLGSLHWIGAGLSMVVFILNRVDEVATNDAQCLGLLTDMVKLGRHVTDLFLRGQGGESVQEAVQIIKRGARWCDRFIKMGTFKRFYFATTNATSFQDIRVSIEKLYPDLTLTKVSKIEEILEEMRKPAIRAKITEPYDKVGLEGRKEEILKILSQLDGNKAQAIILHGIGGIGKSTLGYLIYSTLYDKTDHYVKIDMKMEPNTNDLLDYQKNIIDSVIGEPERKKLSMSDLESGRGHLAAVLNNCQKSMCLYLDNILGVEYLKDLLPGGFTWSEKNKLIITTRESQQDIRAHLANQGVACECYRVEELGSEDAYKLFCKQFARNGPPTGQQRNMDKILKICGGLPLALELIGGYLNSHREEGAWGFVIKSLEKFEGINGDNNSVNKLTRAIEFSYENLNKTLKSMFLDIACLLGDLSWDRLEDIYGCHELNCLVERSLIKKRLRDPTYFREPSAIIHDLLLSLARAEQGGSRIAYEELDGVQLVCVFPHPSSLLGKE